MSNKITIEECQKKAFSLLGYCLSTEYKNNRTKLLWKCNVLIHLPFLMTFDHVKCGSWCSKCGYQKMADKLRGNLEECIIWAKNKRGLCLSTEYKDNKTKMEWICERSHKWFAFFRDIKSGKWCKKCGNISTADKKRGTIQECIAFATLKNGKCLSKEYINNNTEMLWQCKYGHEWPAKFVNIKHSETWCPICAGVAKCTLEDCKKIAGKNNGKCLSIKYSNNQAPMLWECNIGHQWETSLTHIKHSNSWCPICDDQKRSTHTWKSVLDICDQYNFIFESCPKNINENIYNTANDNKQWQFKCFCGNIFYPHLGNFNRHHYGSCGCVRSKAQNDINNIIKIMGFDTLFNDRNLISPKELDIYIPSKNIAIEYCGLYWHGEKLCGIDARTKHFNKLNLCKEKGIRLITIFEDEWINKQAQVEGYLTAILGKVENKIDARKCVISEVDKQLAKQFHNDNHIQGSANGKHLGLYFNNELMCVATFTRTPSSRKKYNDSTIELIRYTAKINYSIRGGLGKLLKYFIRNNIDIKEIISYSDNRWSEGNIYKTLGFVKINENIPSYWYFNGLKREHKCRYQKERLKKIFPNEDINKDTEWDIMSRNGYDRVWDCGSDKYSIFI